MMETLLFLLSLAEKRTEDCQLTILSLNILQRFVLGMLNMMPGNRHSLISGMKDIYLQVAGCGKRSFQIVLICQLHPLLRDAKANSKQLKNIIAVLQTVVGAAANASYHEP